MVEINSPLDAWNALMGTEGMYEVVLPFLLVFAIVYGLLSKLDIFGDNANQVNAVISLVIAAFALATGLIPSWLLGFTSPFALLLIIVLFILIAGSLAGITPGEQDWWGGVTGALAIGGTLLLVWIEGGVSAVFGTSPDVAFGGIPVVTILVIGAAIALIAWMIGLFG